MADMRGSTSCVHNPAFDVSPSPQTAATHLHLFTPLIMALSLFVPLGYITFLLVGMLTFSRISRRRRAAKLASQSSLWFTEGHPERDVYQTLVGATGNAQKMADEMDPAEAAEALAPIHVALKAALLNRAMTDVRRIIRMRDDKQALQTLLQKGSIGDEAMEKFSMAEKEIEAEIMDVVSEANSFREGWGQLIFPQANEMINHLRYKEYYYNIEKQREEEIKKLTEAGKPIPKPRIELPPLSTPPGTQINVTVPGQPGGPPTGPPSLSVKPAANGSAKAKATAKAKAKAKEAAVRAGAVPDKATVEDEEDDE